MNPTLDDLRRTLQDEASTTPLPSADAVVAGAGARVRATQRRRWVAGATAAAVLLAAGVAATLHQGRHSSQPAHTGPFRVVASGGDFPAYSDGGKRLLVVTAPAAKDLRGTVDVPTTPGRELRVLPVCAPSVVFDFDRPEQFTASLPKGDQTQLGCMPGPDITGGAMDLGVPQGRRTPVDVHLLMGLIETRSGPSFTGARVSLGFYERVPWSAYPKPARPTGADTIPNVPWARPPATASVFGPKTAGEANTPGALTVLSDKPARSISLEVRGPGRLRLKINGTEVTGLWRSVSQDGQWMEFYDYSQVGMGIDPSQYTSGSSKGKLLRIEVTPEGFAGPDWRVVVGRQP